MHLHPYIVCDLKPSIRKSIVHVLVAKMRLSQIRGKFKNLRKNSEKIKVVHLGTLGRF